MEEQIIIKRNYDQGFFQHNFLNQDHCINFLNVYGTKQDILLFKKQNEDKNKCLSFQKCVPCESSTYKRLYHWNSPEDCVFPILLNQNYDSDDFLCYQFETEINPPYLWIDTVSSLFPSCRFLLQSREPYNDYFIEMSFINGKRHVLKSFSFDEYVFIRKDGIETVKYVVQFFLDYPIVFDTLDKCNMAELDQVIYEKANDNQMFKHLMNMLYFVWDIRVIIFHKSFLLYKTVQKCAKKWKLVTKLKQIIKQPYKNIFDCVLHELTLKKRDQLANLCVSSPYLLLS